MLVAVLQPLNRFATRTLMPSFVMAAASMGLRRRPHLGMLPGFASGALTMGSRVLSSRSGADWMNKKEIDENKEMEIQKVRKKISELEMFYPTQR